MWWKRWANFLGIASFCLCGWIALSGCENDQQGQQLYGQVHVTLLHTSDIHSRLFPYNLLLGQVDAGLGLGAEGEIVNVGGAARISHIIGRERARSSRVLHIDGGDCFQGAPVFNFFSGEAEVKTLTAMGVDGSLIANHEFDKGALNLGIQLQQNAGYPVLAANYIFEDSSQPGASPLGSIAQPFSVYDMNGLSVAVIGMGNLSSLTSIYDNPNRLGLTPLNTTEVAQFYIDLLRPSVDLVVFVSHLGLDHDEEMIAATTGIDVVLGGHNHIVLQPPKRIQDCALVEEETGQHYVEMSDGEGGKVRRYCYPREVVLTHSGAFAKYVGRLDLVTSNEKNDFENPDEYDPLNGFEVISHNYELFPVNDTVPEDPIVASTLEPYAQGMDTYANLDLLVGYALDGSKRYSTSGGDSPLGNLVAGAMWLRLGIQTDFALTNTLGIRADLVPGPVTLEQMYNIFPFDNSITKMQLSGTEIQDVFDFAARRSASRGCVSQIQIAGARVVIDCTKVGSSSENPGVATHIYIGTYEPSSCNEDDDCYGSESGSCQNGSCYCKSDLGCVGEGDNSCDIETGRCWQPIDSIASYELSTSTYLAQGGSGFRVLQRNTTQVDTQVQQRDALVDYIRQGDPCGVDDTGELRSCATDADCADVGDGYICACPEAVIEDEECSTDSEKSCSSGACVLSQCRIDVAAFQRQTCENAPSESVQEDCEEALSPCASAGEQCKFLACLDRGIGNYSDGRLKMVGQ